MPPVTPPPAQPGIKWNEVTWYSKLGAIILFIFVVPALAFYIGMQYQAVLDLEAVVPTYVNPTPTTHGTQGSLPEIFIGESMGLLGGANYHVMNGEVSYDSYIGGNARSDVQPLSDELAAKLQALIDAADIASFKDDPPPAEDAPFTNLQIKIGGYTYSVRTYLDTNPAYRLALSIETLIDQLFATAGVIEQIER